MPINISIWLVLGIILIVGTLVIRHKGRQVPPSAESILQAIHASPCSVAPVASEMFENPSMFIQNGYMFAFYRNERVGDDNRETLRIWYRNRQNNKHKLTLLNNVLVSWKLSGRTLSLDKISTQTNYQVLQIFREMRLLVIKYNLERELDCF